MNLTLLLIAAAILSIGFHFMGVYAGAKKVVWVMLVFMWAGAIGIALNEISPKGYKYIDKQYGKYSAVDKLIDEAKPEITTMEMLEIKKIFAQEKAAAKKNQ